MSKTKKGKGTKWMVLGDGQGTPLGAYLDWASPAEVTLVPKTLDKVAVRRPGKPGRPRKRPERLIADRAFDSTPLRRWLKQWGHFAFHLLGSHHGTPRKVLLGALSVLKVVG